MSSPGAQAQNPLREARRHDRLRFGPALPWLGCIAFAAIGVLIIGVAAGWWLEYRRSAQWPRADAYIDSVARRQMDGDSTEPRVDCAFHFTFAGNAYRGTRVSLTGQGSYAQDANRNKVWEQDELESHRAKGTPVRCWVDPADPTRAVLFRRIEPRMYWAPVAGMAFLVWSPMFPWLYYRHQRET
jgi:hypothetical protein